MKPALRLASCAVAIAAAGLLPPRDASGYAIEVHKDFYDLAFGGRDAGRSVQPPAAEDLVAFRRFVYDRAAAHPDFRKRWPSFERFDAAAFKEFLLLNPGKRVVGIDHVPADRPTDVRTVVREGSVDPDNDERNQDRLYLDGNEVRLDPFGRAVPYDPRTVWFGGLTGIPSQFDAHGATLRTGKKGGGLWTALRAPEQFARPPVPLGSAPEFSETYTELAMIAALRGGPGGEWLALTFGGNNLHGIEDLGNQIHTTVLGIPEFFLDAKLTHTWLRIRNMFASRAPDPASLGFVPPARLTTDQVNQAMALIKAGKEDQVDPKIRWALGKEPKGQPTDTELGIRIIGNHHRLLEDFVQEQYLAGARAIEAGHPERALPAVRDLIRRAQAGDDAFERRCRNALARAGLGARAKGQTPYARVIAEVMIEASAPEAAPIYRATRKISKKSLQRGGVYDKQLGHDVMDFVELEGNEKHVRTIWELSARAFARVVSAIRLWDEVFQRETSDVAAGSPEALARAAAIVDRLVERQLAALEAAEARRRDYLQEVETRWREEKEAASRPGFLSRIKGWFRGR
ncbi:MAG: hypothetical protein D6731_04090 [Planctomycetota bacterium]|nr:MAG: hypothetical protein D6731_04090 [Planctomycetota bacterium]